LAEALKNPFFKLLMPFMSMMVKGTATKNYTKLKGILESSA